MSENAPQEPVIPQEPILVDNRLAARLAREEARRLSLYNQDPQEAIDAGERHQTRTANLRWGPGEEPYDVPGAVKGDGYVNTQLEVLEHTDPTGLDNMAGVRGTPSGVRCLACRRSDYLIVDRRTSEQRIESQVDVQWAISQGRHVDPLLIEPELMLFCPGCRCVAQMLESAVAGLRHT